MDHPILKRLHESWRIEQDGKCFRTIKTAGDEVFTFQWEERESEPLASKWIQDLYGRKRKLGFSESGEIEAKPQIIASLRKSLEFPVLGYYGVKEGRYIKNISGINVEFLSSNLAHDVISDESSMERIEALKVLKVPMVDIFSISSMGMMEFRKKSGSLFVRESKSKYIYYAEN